jgi:hypothetical protein
VDETLGLLADRGSRCLGHDGAVVDLHRRGLVDNQQPDIAAFQMAARQSGLNYPYQGFSFEVGYRSQMQQPVPTRGPALGAPGVGKR